MFLANTQTYTSKQRKIAFLSLFVILFSICSPVFANVTEFASYSEILKSKGIIERDLVSNRAIIYREALHIAIGIGGYPEGCGPSLSITCDTDKIARARGFIQKTESTLLGGIIRANAMKLILRSANIAPSSNPSGYSDVDGKVTATYAGYIAKARELKCIQTADKFRPFDYVSEGEYAKMSVCVLASPETQSGSFSSAPSTPSSTPGVGTIGFPTATPIYYGGGGGGSTTTVNNYYTSSFTGIVGDFTSTGTANLYNANFTNSVNFSLLPSLPLNYGSMLVGNSGNRAAELTAGVSGQVLGMVGSIPTWLTLSLPTGTGGGLVDSVFGRAGNVTAQAGDYTTNLVTEAANLYFTDSRAQNALSGTVTGINNSISTLNTNFNTLSGVVASMSGINFLSELNTLSGQVASLTNLVNIFSFTLGPIVTTVNSFSGTVSQNIADIITLSGGLASANTNIASLSGILATKISLSSLSATGPIGYNNMTGVFSWSGSTTDVLEGTNLYWTQSRFDTALGLKSTSDLTEGTNLYFTDTRAQNALSGTIASLSGAINTVSSNLSTLSGSFGALTTTVNTLSGSLATLVSTVNSLSGAVDATNANLANTNNTISSLSGVVSALTTTVSTISGSLANLTNTVVSLSGALDTTNTNVANNTANIVSLSGNLATTNTNLSNLTSTVNTISGSLANLTNTVSSLSGTVSTILTTVDTLSGALATTNANLASLSGQTVANTTNISALSGSLATTNSNLTSLSGSLSSLSGTVSTLASQIATLSGQAHDAVTLGSANGLTLSGQVLSLTLASNTTTGALSVADWINFNNKINLTSLSATGGISYNSGTGLFSDTFIFNNGLSRVGNTIGLINGSNGQVLSMSGGMVVWVDPTTVSIPVISVFGRTGTIMAMTGDYLSDMVTEGTTNLYFTDSRAVSALSGSILGIRTDLMNATGNILSLQTNLATATGNISTLSGQITTINTNISSLSGSLATLATAVDSLSGNLSSLSGNLASTDATLSSLSGVVAGLSTNLVTLSGSLSSLTSTVNALSGQTAVNTSSISVLSGTVTNISTTLTSLSGVVSAIISDFSTLSGSLATTNSNLTSLSGSLSSLSGTVSTLASQIATLSGQAHDAVTLGSANGLTLSGQVLSLTLASNTTTGALSVADWISFNNKISLTSLSATGFITYNNTTGVIGWTGTTSGISEGTNLYWTQSRFDTALGLKSTSDLSEGTNLYFTDSRAQNALSGAILGIRTDLMTATGNIATLFTGLATATGQINTLNTNVATITGQLVTVNSNIASATGNILSLQTNLTTATGNIATLSGQITTINTNINNLSGSLSSLSTRVDTISGSLISLTTTVSSLSGVVSVLSGQTATNTLNISALSGALSTTNTNLSTLSGVVSSLSTTISTLSGSLATLSTSVNSLSGQTNLNTSNITTLSGQIATINTSLASLSGAISTLSGSLATTNSNLTSLSGTVSTLLASSHAPVTLGSANGLSLSGQVLSLTLASNTTTGALSVADWINFNNKINLTSLSVTGGLLSYNSGTGLFSWTGTTTNIAEGTNLYFTNARAQSALSGSLSTINSNLATATGNILSLQNNLATATGQINALNTNVATITGQLVTINSNLATATGNIATLSGNLSALSGVVATKISLTSLSASGPLTYNSGSGVFGINIANATTTGALSVADYLAFSGKLSLTSLLTGFVAGSGTVTSADSLLSAFQKLQGSNTIQDTIISNLGINLATATGQINTLNTNVATITGQLVTVNSNIASATGNILSLQSNLTTATGNIATLSGNLTSLSGTVSTLLASSHAPVTLGSANGLSLSGQVLSLTLASNTTTGALSVADWINFNNKINLTSLSVTGGLLSYNSGTGLFSWTGTTTNIAEGTNLYFTNARTLATTLTGFVAGSGTIIASDSLLQAFQKIQGSNTIQDSIISNLGVSLATATGQINTLNTNVATITGQLVTVNSNIASATGNILSLQTNLATATGNIATLFTGLATATGQINTLNTNVATITGNIATLSGQIATLSGLSHAAVTLGTTNGLALSGQQLSLGIASATTTGALSVADWINFNNKISFISGPANGLSISGSGISLGIASSTTTGALSVLDWNTFSNKIGFISGAANGLSITGTGLSLGIASATTTGALSVTDWTRFNSKLGTLNGLTSSGQTFAIGTSGTDFNIISSGSIHTFNLPDASSIARGVVSTGAQVFAGAKTFAVAPTLSGFTQGSVLFASTGGVVAYDNGGIYYNGGNKRLGLGTSAPVATFHNSGSTVLGAITITNRTASGAIGTALATVDIATTFNVNQTGSNITLSLPNPTDATAGRIAYVNNVGTKSFFFLGTQVTPSSSRTVIWNGTAWVLTGNADDRVSGQYRKLADESIASNIVSQDDDHLSFSVSSGETWFFDISVIVRNGATGGARVQMNVPAGSTNCSNSVITNYNGAWFTNATCNTNILITNLNNLAATSNSDEFSYRGVFTAGATGTAKLQWAQRVSNATATIFLKDSTMVVTKLSGADVAEIYYAQDGSIREGEIVSLTGDGVSQVTKSSIPYDSHAIGVISTKPGVVMGEADGAGKPVIVGLAGRVPVKVSTKNGDIKPGDYITTSDIPGIGMKATDAGRVIGKALTGLSGQEQGTIAVFIQNTYFDGVDEAEYANTLGSSGSLGFSSSYALDRFSFMVKKSLTKIDPNFASGGLDTFGSAVSTLAGGVTTISGSVSDLSLQYQTLASDLRTLKAQVDAQTGSLFSLSPEYQAVLDSIRSSAGELTVSVRTTFSEAVTFAKSVVFQSDVTIGGRVTFQDRDMAGTATIGAGARSVRVDFSRPYAVTPKITATADDFTTFRITDKSTRGFTIEIQEPGNAVSFDWIALHVVGARNTTALADESPPDISPEITTASGEIPPLPDIPTDTVSGETVPPDTPIDISPPDTSSGSGPPQDISSSGSSPPVDTSSSGTLTDISTIEPAEDPPLGQTGGAIAPTPTVPDPSPANTPPPGDVTAPVTDTGTDTTLAPSATTVVYDDPGNDGSSPPTGPPSTSTDPPTS